MQVQVLSSAPGLLAQLVERFVYTEDVRGSSPLEPTDDIIFFRPKLPMWSRRMSEEHVIGVRFTASAHYAGVVQ